MNTTTDYLAEAVTEAFGVRCRDSHEDCHCCRAWRQYDTIASLRSKLEEAEGARGWQPIETAPKDGQKILLVVTGYEPAVGWFDGDKWEYQSRGDFAEEAHWAAWQERSGAWRPDHWMHVPPLASLREADHAV